MTMTAPRGQEFDLPPPLHEASILISPELALVDRDLAALVIAGAPDMSPATPAPPLESAARDAMLRICELSDVNTPRARRGPILMVAVPTVLWAEAVLVVASLVLLGAL